MCLNKETILLKKKAKLSKLSWLSYDRKITMRDFMMLGIKEKLYANSLAIILFETGRTKDFTPRDLIDETLIQRDTIKKGCEAIERYQLKRLINEIKQMTQK